MGYIDSSDLDSIATEQIEWELDHEGTETRTYSDMLESALDAARESVDDLLVYTSDVMDTWEHLGRPDYPVGELGCPEDGSIETIIRVAVEWALIEDYYPAEAILDYLEDRVYRVGEIRGEDVDALVHDRDGQAMIDYIRNHN